jgi:hypothetical protein
MTVIRPNSVSGITSITAQANEINVFRSNGLLAGLNLNGVNFNTTAGISTFAALKVTGNLDVEGVLTYQDVTNVDAIGIITARSGVNVSGGQLDVGSNIKLGNAGVITATTFVGNFTGTSSGNAVLTGSTNNELVTVTGANAITGESGLTWTGSVFQLTSSGGNQFPFNVRNDFTPNSQRCDYGYFANSTSNNALRLGSINSNGGVTIQSTRMNDSAQKHNLILNPDGGYVWINKTSTSDYGNFEVKGPTSDNIETSDITAKTVATFSGSTPGTTAAGKGAGIVIKPISNRGCNYFIGVANDSTNQEAHGRFIIRSGNFASATAERLRIEANGHIKPTEHVTIADDKSLYFGNDSNLYIKHSNGHANNFIVSSVGDIEHHMASSKKIIKGFNNSGTPYVSLYYNDTARITTTSDGIEFGGEVNFTSGNNVRTFAGSVYLADGAHADLVQNNSGYAWGFFEFYCISYHGSIGRAYWKGSMSRYTNNDNYTLSNSMGYTDLQRVAGGSPSGQENMIRIQRTGTYGTVQYNYYIRCYAPNSVPNWGGAGYATKKYDGN